MNDEAGPLDKIVRIPLPKGLRRGGRTELTANLLDQYENLVLTTVKIGLETAKVVSWRLSNWLKRNKSNWEPTPDFMNSLAISTKCSVQLSAEFRQLKKIRSAESLTDEEMMATFRPLIIGILDAMTDEEFSEILDERERLKRGECVIPVTDAELVEEGE